VLTYTGVHSTGFRDFLLIPELNRAIKKCGFEHPSEVQQQCIPRAIEGKDIIVQARAGMGKTAVFVISILNQMDEQSAKPCHAVILANTRELAYQIKTEFDRFTEFLPWVRKAVFIGGQSTQNDIKLLKNPEKAPHIIIGTPGRVKKLCQDKHIKGEDVKVFVMDEVDKLIEETDIREQVQRIFMSTGIEKQVMMFSATFPQKARQVCEKFLRNPFKLFLDSDTGLVLHGLKQYYVELGEDQKIKRVMNLLDVVDFNQVIIFTKQVTHAIKLNELLRAQAFPS
jgi:ATP-dependent RNA helicase UAP56/SUB2